MGRPVFDMNGKEWYANLLLRPEWQKKRLKIMERDRWRCVACGVPNNRTLTVHHKGYLTGLMPWEYPDEMLETLCVEHHSERHVFPLSNPDRCIWCGGLVTNENLAGRNGKHEFICEACVRKQAEEGIELEETP